MSDPIDELLEEAGVERDETAAGDVDRFGPRAAWGPVDDLTRETVDQVQLNGLVDPERER